MQAEGYLLMYNLSCPSDSQEFQNALAFALANATNATNVTTLLDYCHSSYVAANYTLVLPISEADKYGNDSSFSFLSTAVAAALLDQGFNLSSVDMFVAMLLFNPIDGEECTLAFNDSACQIGEFLRSYEITIPAKFGGNCTVPEAIILSCNGTNTNSDSSSGLSKRQIAGIVIGSVFGFCFLCCACACLCRLCGRSRRDKVPVADRAPQSQAVRA